MQKIDTRGLSCPEPVVRAQNLVHSLQPGTQAQIVVAAGAARENVLRAVVALGCDATLEECEEDFCIHIVKQGNE